MEDLWSQNKIRFQVTPRNPKSIDPEVIKEITFRSIDQYLGRPGHVLLPNNMLSPEDINASKDDPLIRANLFLQYWHGSGALPCKEDSLVSSIESQFPKPHKLSPSLYHSTACCR